MADTIEKRVQDLEFLLAHLPQDLDARFAGADARAGARFDQLSVRMQAIETRVRQVEQAVANNGAKLQAIETRVGQVDAKVQAIDTRVGQVDAKLDEILSRLPPQA